MARKREPKPSLFTRFVEALEGRDGVDQVMTDGETAIVCSNGGGIKLELSDAPIGELPQEHPDRLMVRADTPDYLRPHFRIAMGETYEGFRGKKPEDLKPVIPGSFCFAVPGGPQGIALPDGKAILIKHWKPERLRPRSTSEELNDLDREFAAAQEG